jgi:C4-dicarboxylate transporter DctM subunit
VTCMLFGAITGSSLATITGIGGMMLPELDKAGYDRRYSLEYNFHWQRR